MLRICTTASKQIFHTRHPLSVGVKNSKNYLYGKLHTNKCKYFIAQIAYEFIFAARMSVESVVLQINKKLIYQKPKSGFQIRSYSINQYSDNLYSQRDEVRHWQAEQIASWMQNNANLSTGQIQLILDKALTGRDVLAKEVVSLQTLCAEHPKATRELWEAFQQFRMAYMIPLELRPEQASFSPDTNILDMPFVGRAEAIEKALVAVQTHANAAINTKSNSNIDTICLGNSCLFAVGAPGIGKTRFGEEFPRLLTKHTTGNLKQKLQNVRTVQLTFRNDKNISTLDLKWKDAADQVNWILTSRAIHAVYNIDQSYKDWALELSKLFGNDLPDYFNMNNVIEELLCRDPSATTIYFHLDEVQQILLLSPVVGAEVIRTLSTLYAKYNSEKLLTLLLFTGTILANIKSVLAVGSSVNLPLVSLPMETLEDMQIYDIISKMKTEGKLPWLQDNWNESTSFKKLVAYLGGVPRLLELLFLTGSITNDVNKMATILSISTEQRYSITDGQPSGSVYNACCLALSGKQFELADKLPNAPEQRVEQLCANGYLFLAPGGQLTVPFVYVGLTVLSGDFAKGKFEGKITDMQHKLLTPSETLLWQDFEAFILIYTMVRVKALLHLKYTTIQVKDYFHRAHTMSKNIAPMQFKLAERGCVELGCKWPESGWPVCRSKGPVNTEDFLDFVFLNAAGSSFDGFEFVELADKQEYVIFAHQNKHTADGKMALSSKSIAEEAEKAQAAFQEWKQLVVPDDQDLMALKEATKQLILIIFTNCNVVLDADCPLPRENLVVVNNYKHFGPFQAVAKLFQASDDKKE